MRALLFRAGEGQNGAHRAHRAAGSAIEVAKAFGEIQIGFQKAGKPVLKRGGLQYARGAGGYTQSAAGTEAQEARHPDAAGWRSSKGRIAFTFLASCCNGR